MEAFLMITKLLANYEEAVALILFCIGFMMLLFGRNMIRKLIGMNIMDTGIYLFLASLGYIYDRKAPIIEGGDTSALSYINPVPSALVLTGIVVSVSVTAVMLSLAVRLYEKYHTLNLDEIYSAARERHEHR